MAKIVDGKDVILYLWNESDSDYLPVACITSHDYSVTVESTTADATKCDPNPEPQAGAASYEITGDGQMLSSDDSGFANKTTGSDIEDVIWDKDEHDWKISGGNSDKYGTGLFTSYSETAPADGKMTFSFTITGGEKPTSDDPHVTEG